MWKKLLALLAALILALCPVTLAEVLVDDGVAITEDVLVEYGLDYTGTEEVALYLHVFCELPPNFLTKNEARDLGWESREGNLWEVAYGMSIGGDRFYNREGMLPENEWYECDVNYEGGYRGGERLVFSVDGEIYYSGSHYEDFELLYDGWYEGEVWPDEDYAGWW